MLIINLKTINFFIKITNLIKISQKINLIETQIQNQCVLTISLITFAIIQNCSRNQRIRSKIKSLIALSAKSQSIEKINV